MLTSNKRISNKEFIVAADKPMKDHVSLVLLSLVLLGEYGLSTPKNPSPLQV